MSRYIDADKLKSEFPIRRNNYDEEHGDVHFINGIETVFEYIDYMLTADVEEVRHGKWERCGRLEGKTVLKCSVCGQGITSMFAPEYHFCPNCGAKMDGGTQ